MEAAESLFQMLADIEISVARKKVYENHQQALDHSNSSGLEFFKQIATIIDVDSEGYFYMECPSTKCYKKTQKMNANDFYCNQCDQSYKVFKHHILLNLKVLASENSGPIITKSFNSANEKILKTTGQEFAAIVTTNESEMKKRIKSLIGVAWCMIIQNQNHKK